MKNIDRLFSNTLQDHTTMPPSGLWERVESELPVASDRKTWLRWAAVLLPAFVAIGMWMNRPEEVPVIASVTSPSPVLEVPKSAQQEVVALPVPRKKRSRLAKQAQVGPSIALQKPVEAGYILEVAVPEEITIEPVALEPEPVIAEPKPIVIVYTLESVAAPDDAEPKATSLDRVVGFARTVKHSDPIGDIRGLKDELLAFDFRKKQTKKN